MVVSVETLYDLIEAGDVEGVDTAVRREPELVEGQGATPPPVHWAIYHDQLAVVDLLLRHGAAIEREDQDRQSTPLAYAVVFGRREIAELLIGRGASVEGMHALALRGAAGEFEQYPDVAGRARFAELAALFEGPDADR